jgi:Zn finger protein HypA/HybF involved in hydrogenase expression
MYGEEKVFCPSCGEVFDYDEVEDVICPGCGGIGEEDGSL